MVQKVKTDAGERWAIVFGKRFTLSDFISLQNGLIRVLQAAGHNSDFIAGMGDELYAVLDLLETTHFTYDQVNEYQRYLESKTSKNIKQ